MVQDPLDPAAGDPPAPVTAGARLRAAREQAGMDVSDIARATRVPQRHLEAIEAGNYAALPSPTYATGFAKAYARAVEVDEVAIAAAVRAEMSASANDPREWLPYETADPKRVPPRSLAWAGAAAALLVIVLFGWWYSLRDAAPDGAVASAPVASGAPAATGPVAASPAPAAVSGGDETVELVATQAAWVRITDATGNRLLEREMAVGERFRIPAAAQEPTIRTGRPEGIDVFVGGQRVAPLGPAGRPVGGVVLTAEALAARPATAAAQSPVS